MLICHAPLKVLPFLSALRKGLSLIRKLPSQVTDRTGPPPSCKITCLCLLFFDSTFPHGARKCSAKIDTFHPLQTSSGEIKRFGPPTLPPYGSSQKGLNLTCRDIVTAGPLCVCVAGLLFVLTPDNKRVNFWCHILRTAICQRGVPLLLLSSFQAFSTMTYGLQGERTYTLESSRHRTLA